jgi:hypothetical protein
VDLTILMQKEDCPYTFGIHCFVHMMILAIEPLSNLSIVEKCISFCQSVHIYFSFSSKNHNEFQKLTNVIEIRRLNVLRNVKTYWISFLEHLRRIMDKYKTLIYKMAEDVAIRILTSLRNTRCQKKLQGTTLIYFMMLVHCWPCLACYLYWNMSIFS